MLTHEATAAGVPPLMFAPSRFSLLSNMNFIRFPQPEEWPQLLARPVMDLAEIESRVAPILREVRERGDAAVREFTARFDKVETQELLVTEQELWEADALVSAELKDAIGLAKANIETFHRPQLVQPEKLPLSRVWFAGAKRGHRTGRPVHSGWLRSAVFYGADAGRAGTAGRLPGSDLSAPRQTGGERCIRPFCTRLFCRVSGKYTRLAALRP